MHEALLSGTVFSAILPIKNEVMTPDKNQTGASQPNQDINDPVSNPQQSQHRPDWIIPDNGISSRNTSSTEDQQRQPKEDSIPLDNDETLGIP